MTSLILDTETTALIQNRSIKIHDQPEVIEFYGCKVDLESGTMVDELWHLIRPRQPVDSDITRITGLTNEELSKYQPFHAVAASIKHYIEQSRLVIAHNASFDQEVIDIEFERLGEKITWPPVLCTVEQTAHIRGFRLSLTALHDHLFGEPFADAHRAKVDVEALSRCCVELRKKGML